MYWWALGAAAYAACGVVVCIMGEHLTKGEDADDGMALLGFLGITAMWPAILVGVTVQWALGQYKARRG